MTVEILTTPPPGAIGRLVELHGSWYARHWDFGPVFEAKVAAGLGEFAEALPHPDARLFVAAEKGQVLGGIAVDGRAEPGVARIRWFIVAEGARGGLGRRLLDAALAFCGQRNFREVWLTTFAGLDAARRLYERAGFALEHEEDGASWGSQVREQRFRLRI